MLLHLLALSIVSYLSLAAETLDDLENFYSPPSDYESAALGTVLKSRPITNLPSYVDDLASVFQLLYRSETALGSPEADVTTFFVPKSPESGDAKIVSYQIPEDAAYLGCAPSYTLFSDNSTDSTLSTLLKAGIYVNVPDYEGPNSSFTAGIKSGRSVLDSLKAVLQPKNDFGLSSDTPLALWGYSGGSIASGWAAQLQPSYAPDINLVGTAVGGYVVNLTATVLLANKGYGAGFIPTGLLGLASQYPEFAAAAEADLYVGNSSALEAVTTQCLTEDLISFLFQNIFTYLKSGEAFLDFPVIEQVMDNQTLGNIKPDSPLFIYQGEEDEIAPVAQVDEAVSKYCSLGATVDYWVNPTALHVAQATAGFSHAFDWLTSRLDGIEANCGCVSTTGSAPLNYTVCATGTNAATSAATSAASATNSSARSVVSTTSGASVLPNTAIILNGSFSSAVASSGATETGYTVTVSNGVTITIPCTRCASGGTKETASGSFVSASGASASTASSSPDESSALRPLPFLTLSGSVALLLFLVI